MSGIIIVILILTGLGWGMSKSKRGSSSSQSVSSSSQKRLPGGQNAQEMAETVLAFKGKIQRLDADLAVFDSLPDAQYRSQADGFKSRLMALLLDLEDLEDTLDADIYQSLFDKINNKYDEIVHHEDLLTGRLTVTPHQADLQALQDQIEQVNADIIRGNHLLSQGRADDCLVLFKTVSRKLENILRRAEELEDLIDEQLYDELVAQVHASQADVALTLERLDDEVDEADLDRFAPEIFDTVHNIQLSHASIVKKITKSDSSDKEELLALHETQMRQFHDILAGYLKIKRSPTDYYDADERLEQAKTALESFDQQLLTNIRQLNENDLYEFKISLRMMGE